MGKNEKILLIVGGVGVAYLAYRYASGGSSSTTTTAATPDTSSQDYASLAGQEQGDVAQLQQQIGALTSQEQSDVQTLSGQESGDVATLGGTITSLGGLVKDLGGVVTTNQNTNQKELAKLAAGLAATSREAKKALQVARKGRNVAPPHHGPKPSHKPAHVGGGFGVTGRGTSTKPGGGFGGNAAKNRATHPKEKGKQTAKPHGKPHGKGGK